MNCPFYKFFLCFSCSVLLSTYTVHSQSLNYKEIFSNNWDRAMAYEEENRRWMAPMLAENNISYPLAIAIIFPELVRYSALRDKMEITLLKALYINLGDEYANFSIGRFQMKPSFAQTIREQTIAYLGRKGNNLFPPDTGISDVRDLRKQIVAELEDPHSQLNYLIAFIKICDKKYKTGKKDEVSRIRFLSTAYNYGIDKNATQIESITGTKFFNTQLVSGVKYSYSEVSIFWYNEFLKEKRDQ